MEKPKMHINYKGPEGNIFSIVGRARNLLPKQEAEEMGQRVFSAHSYGAALKIISDYVRINIEGVDGEND